MSYDSNMYYSPEHYGLRILEEVNDPWASYSFDMFVVWVNDETGAIYYGTDTGCSCPAPFEQYNLSYNHLHSLVDTNESWDEFCEILDEYYEGIVRYYSEETNNFRGECNVLRIAVQHYLMHRG